MQNNKCGIFIKIRIRPPITSFEKNNIFWEGNDLFFVKYCLKKKL